MRVYFIFLFFLFFIVACGNKEKEVEVTKQHDVISQATHKKNNKETVSPEKEREDYIRSNIVSIAEKAFPDDKGLKWDIKGIEHKDKISYAEVEPKPDQVGYSRIKFIISFRDMDKHKLLGAYVWDAYLWELLFGEDPNKIHP